MSVLLLPQSTLLRSEGIAANSRKEETQHLKMDHQPANDNNNNDANAQAPRRSSPRSGKALKHKSFAGMANGTSSSGYKVGPYGGVYSPGTKNAPNW